MIKKKKFVFDINEYHKIIMKQMKGKPILGWSKNRKTSVSKKK